MQVRTIKKWFWVHRWTSLICTIFLLDLCLTGLPLIFADEIYDYTSRNDPKPAFDKVPKGTPMVNLDNLVKEAEKRYPNDKINSLGFDDDDPQIFLGMHPKSDTDMEHYHSIQFDSHTGKVLKDEGIPKKNYDDGPTFMGIMFSLHMNLFLKKPGRYFLTAMGFLLLFSVVSGYALYGPFMKKLNFGTIRNKQSKRLKWLDLHNLLGVVLGTWMLIMGATGIMNDLSSELFATWRAKEMSGLNEFKNAQITDQSKLSSLQQAFDSAQKAIPGMQIGSVTFPNKNTTPYHYLFWAQGNSHVTKKLFYPILVDGRNGRLTGVLKMPWYLRTLEICRPLHFGDYGGVPLKIIWAILDVIFIVVLISGIYLWFVRRKKYKEVLNTMR